MNSIHVIGDRETVLAFALGGIPGDVVRDAYEARAALQPIVAAVHQAGGPRHAPALVLVTHSVANWIRTEIEHLILDAKGPFILMIPGFHEHEDELGTDQFVERVLGGQR